MRRARLHGVALLGVRQVRKVAGDIDMSFVSSLKMVRKCGVSAKLLAAHGTFVRTQGGVRGGCVLLKLIAAGEFLVTLAAVESPSLVQDVLVRRCQLQRLERLSTDLTIVTHSFVVLLKHNVQNRRNLLSTLRRARKSRNKYSVFKLTQESI